ncbi:prolipoprotein diacylglyceryl transferase [Dissulfuribacter thermophilus]|nr:prolipoprotein diacylglyceryl transferase [Dissulfuribacter thermophilus]
MIPYPNIDPVIFRIGPFAVRWYGIMYLVGFLCAWILVKREIKRQLVTPERVNLELAHLESLMAYLIIGVILGGRIGYCLFYNLDYFLEHPLEIFATWHGGMSFHGGAIGAIAAGLIFCKRYKESFFKWADRFVWPAPIGLGLGRIANFINGELFGRPSDVPWAMIFPGGGPIPRHPSQLYEALLEGPILFLLLSLLKGKDRYPGGLFSLFLIIYGFLRFFAEFFREPDPQLGFILFGWMTMGQILSLCMICVGIILFLITQKPRTQRI